MSEPALGPIRVTSDGWGCDSGKDCKVMVFADPEGRCPSCGVPGFKVVCEIQIPPIDSELVEVIREGLPVASVATCTACDWHEVQLDEGEAQRAAVWHVHTEHQDIWATLFGDREPKDRRPDSGKYAG